MRILKWLDEHFEEYIMVVLLALIASVMMLQIIMRYVFNASLSWPEEFTRYCFIWSTFLGVSYCIKRGISLKVDVLFHYLPKSITKYLNILVDLIVIIFFFYLAINSVNVVKDIFASGQISPAMGIPMHYIYLSGLIGFSLSAIRGIQRLILTITTIKEEKLVQQ